MSDTTTERERVLAELAASAREWAVLHACWRRNPTRPEVVRRVAEVTTRMGAAQARARALGISEAEQAAAQGWHTEERSTAVINSSLERWT
jgi:hypothetical protein